MVSMYPPPNPEVLESLTKSVVELVSFGQYVVHISLSNGNKVSLSCPFRFDTEALVGESTICEFPLSDTKLLRVLGASIEKALCDLEGTLHLRFSNADVLTGYATDQYESYTLSISGKDYVI